MQEQYEIWNLIIEYYKKRGLKWPDFDDAMKFALTEVGEVYEIDLAREGGWVRNNPDAKPEFDKERLSTELGDVIMMLMVAGIVEGVNPLASLVTKINKKIEAINTYKQLPLKEVEHE
jgi:NTP pyrophosphatase (non-canonical NTP hydrolase)